MKCILTFTYKKIVIYSSAKSHGPQCFTKVLKVLCLQRSINSQTLMTEHILYFFS